MLVWKLIQFPQILQYGLMPINVETGTFTHCNLFLHFFLRDSQGNKSQGSWNSQPAWTDT